MTAKILPLRPRKPVQAQGDECRCISCRSDLARVVPCEKDNDHEQG